MQILDHNQVIQKVKRLAYQVAEENFGAASIVILGINNNGLRFARMVEQELSLILPNTELILSHISLNPANPLQDAISVGIPSEQLNNKNILVVDDVANTGRTLYFALQPLMQVVPAKVEVAVLVNREHKSFPIKVDYQGLSLATTLKENIEVNLLDQQDYKAHLN